MKMPSSITLRATLAAVFATLMCVLQEVHGAEFISGGEAKRVCEAYKLICPAKKVCVLQSIEWPQPMKFPVCVHERHVPVKSSICRKPPRPGKCGAKFTRWYFNVHMGACSWFTYGGCGGNQNNFRTAEECEQRCLGITQENNGTEARDENNNVFVNDDEEGRKPELIAAQAKAPEVIELNSDIRASLQLNQTPEERRAARKEERRRRKRLEREERRRLRRLERRMKKRKNRKNETTYPSSGDNAPVVRQPARKLTPYELGPNFDTPPSELRAPNYAELRGSETTYSRFENSDVEEPQVWMIDQRFRRRKGRGRRRNGGRNGVSRSRGDNSHPYVGAGQNSYYDRVKLFDILQNQEEEKTNQV